MTGVQTCALPICFAAAVAEFGMLLRNSEFKATATYANVLLTAQKALGLDKEGYRGEFIKLVGQAQSLAGSAAINMRRR